LLIQDGLIRHADDLFDPFQIYKIVSHYCQDIRPLIFSRDEIVSIIRDRIKNPLEMWNIGQNSLENIGSKINKVYFFHSHCLACLRLDRIDINQDDSGRTLIFFPEDFLPSEFDGFIESTGLKVPLYIDINNIFGFGFSELLMRDEPLVIDLLGGS
jgi:hypothetical protein